MSKLSASLENCTKQDHLTCTSNEDKMIFCCNCSIYYDSKDGQLLAKKMSEIKTESVFEDIGQLETENEKTIVIKRITNPEWSDKTKEKGVFYIEEKGRDRKGLSLTKADLSTLSIKLKEVSEL